jgi:hypothetical protein
MNIFQINYISKFSQNEKLLKNTVNYTVTLFWPKFVENDQMRTNWRQHWSKFFQTGRIVPKTAYKKPTMGRISANLDDIRPKSVAESVLRSFDCF